MVDWLSAENIQTGANVLISLSILGGLVAFVRNAHRVARARQEQVYLDIERVFYDFQRTILEHPGLDVAWVPLSEAPHLTDAERVQQTVIFEMATSMFERAYLLYKDAPRSVRIRQWPGWEEYIRGYCARESYRQWWRTTYVPEDSKNFYDTEFAKFMDRLLR